MNILSEKNYPAPISRGKEKILQFGEGNFLRAFFEPMVEALNRQGFDGSVVLVQPRGGHPETCRKFRNQNNLYTVVLRGRQNGAATEEKQIITCVSRCLDPQSDWEKVLQCGENPDLRLILSNTTEAGIRFDPACGREDAPPSAFPAKLLQVLYRRYKARLPGVWILPCELSDNNGTCLKTCLEQYAGLWSLEEDFLRWLRQENTICNTLVDRIVTGFPKEPVSPDYEDALAVAAEPYAAWVIEADSSLEQAFGFRRAGLPVYTVTDIAPYRERKVRILNGAHTSLASVGTLAGCKLVRDCMHNPLVNNYVNRLWQEDILPTLPLPEEELKQFLADVTDRFDNPFIDHALHSIALNATAKWSARLLPTLRDFVKIKGTLPRAVVFSLAALFAYYRKGTDLQDEPRVLQFYEENRSLSPGEFTRKALQAPVLWPDGTPDIPGLDDAVSTWLRKMEEEGMEACLKHF